jgi:hypothetical protein
MIRLIRHAGAGAVLVLGLAAAGCATLNSLGAFVRAPRFEQAPDRPAEVRWVPPSAGSIYGGAGVRLWVQVTNPNRFGFTLSRLKGALHLQDAHAADVDLPLGLPLEAGAEAEFPIDLMLSFADLPGLGEALRRAAGGQPIDYRLDGTIGVEAGQFGQPEFGPRTLIRGEVRVPRIGRGVAPSVFVRQPQQ